MLRNLIDEVFNRAKKNPKLTFIGFFVLIGHFWFSFYNFTGTCSPPPKKSIVVHTYYPPKPKLKSAPITATTPVQQTQTAMKKKNLLNKNNHNLRKKL